MPMPRIARPPRKIAHVNLNARDFDGSLRFFTETLGFARSTKSPLWFPALRQPRPLVDRARQDQPPTPITSLRDADSIRSCAASGG